MEAFRLRLIANVPTGVLLLCLIKASFLWAVDDRMTVVSKLQLAGIISSNTQGIAVLIDPIEQKKFFVKQGDKMSMAPQWRVTTIKKDHVVLESTSQQRWVIQYMGRDMQKDTAEKAQNNPQKNHQDKAEVRKTLRKYLTPIVRKDASKLEEPLYVEMSEELAEELGLKDWVAQDDGDEDLFEPEWELMSDREDQQRINERTTEHPEQTH